MSQRRRTRSPEMITPQVMRRSPGSTPIRPFGGGYQSPILQLQRTLGNRRVAQLIRARRLTPQGKIIGLQRKLTVGAADDQYEQEADRVARRVMSMPDIGLANSIPSTLSPEEKTTEEDKERILQTKPLAAEITPFVQRQTENSEESEEKEVPLQTKSSELSRKSVRRQTIPEEEETEPIQARSARSRGDSFEAGDEIESRINQSKGGGNRLPGTVREYMEPRFGTDFSHVRVHTGIEAAQLNRDVGANAFTHGSDIYYGAGNTPENLELTAHELTHVVQQTGSVSLQAKQLNERSKEVSVQRTIGDGHDLTSPRFSGDAVLEACFDNERLLRVGSQGDAVSKLQQALIDAGFPLPKFGVDGIFGNETRTAVRDFQQASGITIDGLVGPQTMGALDTRFSGPTPPPTPPGPTPPGPTPPGPTPPGPTPPGPTPPGPTPPGPTPPVPPPPETITSQTVVTSPGARTRTTIGVGEEVNLTHAPGSAAWTTTSGTLSAANGVTVIFTAPDTAKRITVNAGTATISFDVVAPTSVAMDREPGTGVKHTLNQADSGIQTRVFLGPDTVNFSRVRYRELNVAGVPTTPGVYSCNTFSTGHCSGATAGACPDKALTDTVVAGKGTQSVLGDCAYSGHCGTAPPFVPGSITVNIPYEYKVGTGAFRAIRNVAQIHTLDADASTLTSSKAGATGSTTVAAAGVVIPQCP
ncbi:DUF4157 domain-containing protein [Nitrosospira sp. NpAV]|uniref:eCIS core domain-containing protein n=1 Tax=Nitrosospira sp. NpAV TaxID=58133 RepID=UPI000A03DBFF|nr:DUF4157 domain-containing protein [Nitrosospira sp. NpAV]